MGLLPLRFRAVTLMVFGLLPAACATRGSLVPPDIQKDGDIPDDLGGNRSDASDDVALTDRADVPCGLSAQISNA